MSALVIGPGGEIEVNNDTGAPLRVDVIAGSIAITGISGTVEVANDIGNPLPVNVTSMPEVEIKNDIGNPVAVMNGMSPLSVSGTVEVANDVGNPLPVNAIDLDIRNLTAATDTATIIDAAEDTAVTWQPISFSTSGAHTIVVVNPGQRLRLRRFLPTSASVPDPTGDPVLSLTLGGQTLRSQALIGRFNILGDDGEDLVIISSKTGQIDGTVGYRIE